MFYLVTLFLTLLVPTLFIVSLFLTIKYAKKLSDYIIFKHNSSLENQENTEVCVVLCSVLTLCAIWFWSVNSVIILMSS